MDGAVSVPTAMLQFSNVGLSGSPQISAAVKSKEAKSMTEFEPHKADGKALFSSERAIVTHDRL